MSLQPPPRDLASIPLATRRVSAASLVRVSRYATDEPFFGRTASNRFDDRSRRRSARFGTCYCGFDLETAIAETVLHDEMPTRGRFLLSYSDFAARWLVGFPGGESLVLANLSGPSLKILGGDGALSTVLPYELPQLWAMAIHRHPQQVDGILYMSRHLNDRPAAVVFERAAASLGAASCTPLVEARSLLSAIAELRIGFEYP